MVLIWKVGSKMKFKKNDMVIFTDTKLSPTFTTGARYKVLDIDIDMGTLKIENDLGWIGYFSSDYFKLAGKEKVKFNLTIIADFLCKLARHI